MTQAYNLSQLANNLNSSGQLDATDGLVNAVPVANGGTGASDAATARSNLGLAIGTNIPSVSGAGATGTWGINISGNAATASSATTATTAINATNVTGTVASGATGTTQSNNDNSTKIATTAYVQNMTPGWSQTWQDVTGSRVLNTNYTNSTGKPIMVQVSQWTYDNGPHGKFFVGSVQVTDLFSIGGDGANTQQCHSVIVPAGSTYRVEGSTIVLWAELR